MIENNLLKTNLSIFQFLINDFLKMVKNVKLEVRPLLLPHLVKLTNHIEPGVTQLTWVSQNWQEFVDKANEAIKVFKVLVKTLLKVLFRFSLPQMF